MTPEEEQAFRKAAREALTRGDDVVMVARLSEVDPERDAGPSWFDEVADFTVVQFPMGASGIVIPAAWQEEEDMEARLHGILREESKALAGEALD